jgi:CDP-paratose 2-epimerase
MKRVREVVGVDSNLRSDFFGPDENTTQNLRNSPEKTCRFTRHDLDIHNRQVMPDLVKEYRPALVIHCVVELHMT